MTAPLPALLGVGALAAGLQAFFGPNAQQTRKRNKQVSSLRTSNRTIAIVTTAALPWMTGTSINPLLRAAYLSKLHTSKVILVVPWIPEEDQRLIFPDDRVYATQAEQAAYIKQWIEARTAFECTFKVYFYDARYRQGWGSIFPTGDIPSVIPDEEADVAILEEPEHLNWFQHGTRWTAKFRHVVGIIHTNYLSYVRPQQNGFLNAVALYRITKWACRIHCHKVIKLSDAVQRIPRSITVNVHGVSPAFVEFGRQRAAASPPRFPKGAYFIGKCLWAKGYTELLDLLSAHQQSGHDPVPLDVVGKGEDLEAVKQLAGERQLPLTFLGARDHLDPSLQEYKVLVNPSRSDVVATTTAEALAMGRWVVVEDLPCNEFFKQFPNTLLYKTPEQFSCQLLYALGTEPTPLTEEVSRQLTWEAATERLLEVGSIEAGEWPNTGEEAYDSMLWKMYKSLAGLKVLKAAMGMTSATGVEVDPTEPTTPDFTKIAEEEDPDLDAALDSPALRTNPHFRAPAGGLQPALA